MSTIYFIDTRLEVRCIEVKIREVVTRELGLKTSHRLCFGTVVKCFFGSSLWTVDSRVLTQVHPGRQLLLTTRQRVLVCYLVTRS